MNNFLIVLLGPTGVGKTEVSVNIARQFACDIISADSRQFFREMKIGTAVPGESLLKEIKHHFIQFLSVKDYYSSSLFESDVLDLLPLLYRENNLVVMTGGSGMYIDAVCEGIDDIPDIDPLLRERLLATYDEKNIESLRARLKELDPEHFNKVDLSNPKRIIRALEICESTGKPYSSFLKKNKRKRDFEILKIGLERPRNELYTRINQRVDEMIENGLEQEAMELCQLRSFNALKSVGYREFFDYFDNRITLEKAIELIKRNSRHYAKRQITWWKKDNDIIWFHPGQTGEIIGYIKEKTSMTDSSASKLSLADPLN
jgi:tRNA dimethylallyltransferase